MSGRVAQGWRSLSHNYRQRPYGVLFLSLLVTLVASPIAAEFQLRTWPIELLLIVNLAVAAIGYDTPRGRGRLLAVVIVTAILRILGRWLHIEAAADAAALLSVLLAVLATIAALRFALRGRKVDSERLCAALSAYLLAGLCFGIVYFQVEQLRPGSFAIGGAATKLSQLDLQTAFYFSFVTLTTLGYGDISPLTPTTRGVAISEAILGQLYLAVLVARLVGGAGPREGPE